jgi:putative protein kinase ArgK-like GTPase of G3E family
MILHRSRSGCEYADGKGGYFPVRRACALACTQKQTNWEGKVIARAESKGEGVEECEKQLKRKGEKERKRLRERKKEREGEKERERQRERAKERG